MFLSNFQPVICLLIIKRTQCPVWGQGQGLITQQCWREAPNYVMTTRIQLRKGIPRLLVVNAQLSSWTRASLSREPTPAIILSKWSAPDCSLRGTRLPSPRAQPLSFMDQLSQKVQRRTLGALGGGWGGAGMGGMAES